MDRDRLERIEAMSQQPMRPDEAVGAYIDRVARMFDIDRALAEETIAVLVEREDASVGAFETFCEHVEARTGSGNDPGAGADETATAAETEPDEPTLADRVEASEDFGAALEQSTALLVQYRRIFLLLLIGSVLVTATAFVYLNLG